MLTELKKLILLALEILDVLTVARLLFVYYVKSFILTSVVLYFIFYLVFIEYLKPFGQLSVILLKILVNL